MADIEATLASADHISPELACELFYREMEILEQAAALNPEFNVDLDLLRARRLEQQNANL